MLAICIQMVGIPFEWFEFAFDCFIECFEFALESLESYRMVRICIRLHRICIRMVRIPVEWLQFAFDWFECHLNVSNLQSNG